MAAALVTLVVAVVGSGASAVSAATTGPPIPTTTTAGPARSGSTTTTRAPARCDPVPPTAIQFVGTASRADDNAVRFHVDDVRVGTNLDGTDIDVTYVRDARFFRVGTRYLVTVAQDPESGSYVSKVRTLRGTDARCVAVDPIYTALADGKAIDTGTFAGLRGTRGRVLRAVLLPLGVVLAALVALVVAKWSVILLTRGVRRLLRS